MDKPERTVQWITRQALAERWAVSYMTVRRREKSGYLTPRKIPGTTTRYDMNEVRHLEAMGVQTTTDAPARIRFLPCTSRRRRRVCLPLLSTRVCAGFPSPADDHQEGPIDLVAELIRNEPATFLFRATGQSMRERFVRDGDLLIMDRSLTPKSGDVVAATLNGDSCIKFFCREGNRMWLESANPDYPPIEVGPDAELVIEGVLTWSLHKLRVGR